MKKTLQDLFEVDHPTLFEEFASKTITGAYAWAIERLNKLILCTLDHPEPYSPEQSEKRNYLISAREHFQGNLDEIFLKTNTALREKKPETAIKDLIDTVA